MIKTIDFAGIELDNYTVREMIMNIEKKMSDHGFHTIEEVNMDTLMMAESDDVTEASYTDTTAASGKTYEYAVCGCRIGETKDVFMQMSDTMTITVP